MKKPVALSAVFLLFYLLNISATAQEDKPAKKGTLEISLGFNAIGPNNEMDKIMVDNGFDATTTDWFWGNGQVEHPHYSKIGFSVQMTYSRYFTKNSQWGIMVSYSDFDEIWGATEDADLLGIDFSNFTIIPLYRYDFANVFELTAGPALLINFGERISSPTSTSESYTAIAPGLLCGLNLKIWNRRVTCGKIGSNYLFAAKSNMGPFTTSGWTGDISIIPESKIGFGHLMVYFAFGFHL
jgi:hypothetical protein